jgi:hypothetical protein
MWKLLIHVDRSFCGRISDSMIALFQGKAKGFLTVEARENPPEAVASGGT